MRFIVVYSDGRYICSTRMLTESLIFARRFKNERQAKIFIDSSEFSPSLCTIRELDEEYCFSEL